MKTVSSLLIQGECFVGNMKLTVYKIMQFPEWNCNYINRWEHVSDCVALT